MSHNQKRAFSQIDPKKSNNVTLVTENPPKRRKISLFDYFANKAVSSGATNTNQNTFNPSPSTSPDIVVLESPRKHPQPISLLSQQQNNEEIQQNNEEIRNTEITIINHEIRNEWYYFQVKRIKDPHKTIWLKHEDLDKYKTYHTYLEEHQIQVEDAENKVYIIEKVMDHHYNEDTEHTEFLVGWQGYSSDDNTWEPHQCLQGNRRYIEYCISHHLDCEQEKYSDLEDQNEDDIDKDQTYIMEDDSYIEVLNDDQSDIEILTNDDIQIIPNNQEKDHDKENIHIKDIQKRIDKMEMDDEDTILSVMSCNNKNKNIKKTMVAMEEEVQRNDKEEVQQNDKEEVDDNAANYKLKSKCYGCSRDWHLCSLEWYKEYPICNSCPKHIRLYCAKHFKEDWFCPLCIHNAHCVLFNGDTQCMSIINAICTEQRYKDKKKCLFLYIKLKDNEYWKTFTVNKVNDIATGHITVKTKKKKSMDIVLNGVDCTDILWALKVDGTSYKDSEIHKVIELKDDGTTLIKNKNKVHVIMKNEEIMTTHKYFNAVAKTKLKALNRGLRAKIFKYSQVLLTKQRVDKMKQNKFGANTIIKETAPVNSRYFDGKEQKENDLPMDINTDCINQLLHHFNIKEIPQCHPPKRSLKMEDIAQYSLVLIIGESGSGKSSILRSLQRHNPSLIKLCEPSSLEWDNNKCIISQFNTSTQNAMSKMSCIGLNNVRTWLKPFNILSQGEKYRAAFARLLQTAEDNPNYTIMMDEFTSVLDRTNARCMSAAISKYIHGNKGKIAHFILASANADIIRYLQPNLVISLGENDEMKWFSNPHNTNIGDTKPDVKVILDLPDFKRTGLNEETVKSHPSYKNIEGMSTFDSDLVPYETISVGNEVRELQCKVVNDAHAKHTATVLDVEGFDGCTITQIPCLSQHHIERPGCHSAFNVGIIYGASGCGKTTSGERLFGRPKEIKWSRDTMIVAHFDDINDFKQRFSAVELPLRLGFAYFDNLSEGEQHRANIARYLGFDNVIIDEFTSYLDRETAKKVAFGVSNYIYKENKKNMVFLCCKSDIISSEIGLHPNWVFDVQNKKITHYEAPKKYDNLCVEEDKLNELQRKHNFIDITSLRNCWNPIKIRLYLRMSHKSDFSPKFARFHYMDAQISTSCRAWTVWAHFMDENDDIQNMDDIDDDELELAGFISVINHFGKKNIRGMGDKQMDYREHRTVILPSFQGLGFGSRVADAIGEYLALHGYRLHSKTAHPRYGGYRDSNAKDATLWIPTPKNHKKTAKIEWKSETQRTIFGNQLDTIGTKKKYYIHLYKLHHDDERTKQVNDKLKSRVIVKRKYRKIKM